MLFLSFVTEETTTSVDKRQKLNNLLQMTNNRINKISLKIVALTKLLNITKTSTYQKSYSHALTTLRDGATYHVSNDCVNIIIYLRGRYTRIM